MALNQKQIRKFQYSTLALLKAATNLVEPTVAYCLETKTLYEFVSSGAAYATNDESITITGDGGNTRWVGIAGQYINYDNTTSGLAAENVQAAIDEVNSNIVPAGVDTQIQFNDGGVFGGDAELTFDKTKGQLLLGDTVLGGSGKLCVEGDELVGAGGDYDQVALISRFLSTTTDKEADVFLDAQNSAIDTALRFIRGDATGTWGRGYFVKYDRTSNELAFGYNSEGNYKDVGGVVADVDGMVLDASGNVDITGDVTASNINAVTESTSNVLTITDLSGIGTAPTIEVAQSDTTTDGYLSSADWNTFNGKQDALTFGIANTNAVKVDDASAASTMYARFTATGIEGRTTAEVLADIGAFPTYSAATGITAYAGGGQGSATELTNNLNEITTCATAGDSVKLPATFSAGMPVTVVNSGAARADLYPASGDTIGGLAADTAIQVLPGQTVRVQAITANSAWLIV